MSYKSHFSYCQCMKSLGHLYIMESFMCALYANNEGMNNYNLKPPNAGTI